MLFRRQHRRFHFIQIRKGFEHHHIRAGFLTGLHDFRIGPVCFFKWECPQRFQQLPQRTYVQRHHALPTLFLHQPHRFHGRFHVLLHHFIHGIPAALQLIATGTEGIGVDAVCALLDIFHVDVPNFCRMGHAVHRRIFSRLQSGMLQIGSHAAVQNDQLFLHAFNLTY